MGEVLSILGYFLREIYPYTVFFYIILFAVMINSARFHRSCITFTRYMLKIDKNYHVEQYSGSLIFYCFISIVPFIRFLYAVSIVLFIFDIDTFFDIVKEEFQKKNQ